MKKFGIYALIVFINMIICVRAGINIGEGSLQWFLVLMAMINLFMLFSLVDTGRAFSELELEKKRHGKGEKTGFS